MAYSVVLDTCVLYPAYLRDTLLRLALAGTYRALWSDDILRELRSNLSERIGEEKTERIVGLMRDHFEDALVEGYEPLVASMTNDEKDRHVLAAAVRANAAAIVTFNLDDFPEPATEPYGVDVIDPDDFLLDQLSLLPGRIMQVLDEQAAAHRRPPREVTGLLSALERAGAPQFSAEARRHLRPDDE